METKRRCKKQAKPDPESSTFSKAQSSLDSSSTDVSTFTIPQEPWELEGCTPGSTAKLELEIARKNEEIRRLRDRDAMLSNVLAISSQHSTPHPSSALFSLNRPSLVDSSWGVPSTRQISIDENSQAPEVFINKQFVPVSQQHVDSGGACCERSGDTTAEHQHQRTLHTIFSAVSKSFDVVSEPLTQPESSHHFYLLMILVISVVGFFFLALYLLSYIIYDRIAYLLMALVFIVLLYYGKQCYIINREMESRREWLRIVGANLNTPGQMGGVIGALPQNSYVSRGFLAGPRVEELN